MASSSALQEGAHTACDLPRIFLETICERARCLPHMKQDMVAAPNDVAALFNLGVLRADGLDLERMFALSIS